MTDSDNVQSLEVNPHPLPIVTSSWSTEKLLQNTVLQCQHILVVNNIIILRMRISILFLVV